jgi:hypothetical protein
MAELNIDLHPAQLEIFNSTKRFKIVAAGRRFGKSYLSAWILLIKAIQSESKDVFYSTYLSTSERYYVGYA